MGVGSRARAGLCGLSPCQAAGREPSSCLSERLPPTDPPRPPPRNRPAPKCLICITPPQRRLVSWETGAHNKGQSAAPPRRRRTRQANVLGRRAGAKARVWRGVWKPGAHVQPRSVFVSLFVCFLIQFLVAQASLKLTGG